MKKLQLILQLILLASSINGQSFISLDLTTTRFPVGPVVSANAFNATTIPGSFSGPSLGFTQVINNQHALSIEIGNAFNGRSQVESLDYRWPSELETGSFLSDSTLFHNYLYIQRINYITTGLYYHFLPYDKFESLTIKIGSQFFFKYSSDSEEYFYQDGFGTSPGSGFLPAGELESYKSIVPVLYLGANYNFTLSKKEGFSFVRNIGFNLNAGYNFFVKDFREDLENDETFFLKLGFGVTYRI